MSLSTNFYRNLSIALLCINLALLAFFFLKPPPPQHGAAGNHAKKLMNLDQEQETQFKAYADIHKKKISTSNEQQRQLLEQYFLPLVDPSLQVSSDNLLASIKALEEEKIKATYQHFQEIKSLLKEDQHAGFKDFVEKSMSRILQGNKKRKH